jgi:hypothetical protein
MFILQMDKIFAELKVKFNVSQMTPFDGMKNFMEKLKIRDWYEFYRIWFSLA